MNQPSSGEVSTEEKIKILLQEYTTLRQEIIARTSHGFQMLSVGAVLFSWIILTKTRDAVFWLILVFALSIFAVGIWFTWRDIEKAAKRIRQLEQSINNRAGEELLVWESKWGSGRTGWFGRARPIGELEGNKKITAKETTAVD